VARSGFSGAGGALTSNDAPYFSVCASSNWLAWLTPTDAPVSAHGARWSQDFAATNLPNRHYRVIEWP